SRIDDKHFICVSQRDGLRRASEFPSKAIGHCEPDAAHGDERLRERLERPRLREIRRPGLEVGLRGKPRVKDRIGVSGLATKTASKKPQTPHEHQAPNSTPMRASDTGLEL